MTDHATLIQLATDLGNIDLLVSLYHQLPANEQVQFDTAMPNLAEKYGLPKAANFVTFIRDIYDPSMLSRAFRETDRLIEYLKEGGYYRAARVSEENFRSKFSFDVGRIAYWILRKTETDVEFNYASFLHTLMRYSRDKEITQGFMQELALDKHYSVFEILYQAGRDYFESRWRPLLFFDQKLWVDYVKYYCATHPFVLEHGNVLDELGERGMDLTTLTKEQLVNVLEILLFHRFTSELTKANIAEALAKSVFSFDYLDIVRALPYEYTFFSFHHLLYLAFWWSESARDTNRPRPRR